MIHIFHGFLGSPSDFAFLEGDGVLLHDLYAEDFFPEIGPQDTLIGYSMGGRIALELASKINFNLKNVVLINSHPGLASQEERDLRGIWEESILSRLKSMTSEDFMTYWNELPIFDHDKDLKPLSPERFERSKDLFEKFRLSLQPNFLPEIIKHLDKVQWIIGLKDQKYLTLTEEILLPHDLRVTGMEGGHRLFQHPNELKSILHDEGIL